MKRLDVILADVIERLEKQRAAAVNAPSPEFVALNLGRREAEPGRAPATHQGGGNPGAANRMENGPEAVKLPAKLHRGGNVKQRRTAVVLQFRVASLPVGRDMATAKPRELPRSAVVISLATWKLDHASSPCLRVAR